MRIKTFARTRPPTIIVRDFVSSHVRTNGEKFADLERMALSASVQRERLAQLLKEEDNAMCADCREPGPTWASTNHGTFICTQCAGVHR